MLPELPDCIQSKSTHKHTRARALGKS